MKDEGVIEPDEENEENLVEEEDEEVELQMNRETQNELEKGSDEENAMSMILVNKHLYLDWDIRVAFFLHLDVFFFFKYWLK